MKLGSILLCLLFLGIILTPCSDGSNREDELLSNVSDNHDHSEDSDDSCAILCFCNCCGATVTYQPLNSFEFAETFLIVHSAPSHYTSIYQFNYSSQPWEPPKCIS